MDVNKTTKALETLAKGKAWSVDSTKVYWNDSGSAPTQSEIDAQIAKDDNAYTATKYQRDRSVAYDPIKEQLDQLYWDKKNGTNKWVEAIDKVKSDNPKP